MAQVKDIRVSFVGKGEDGKYKRVDFHVHNVEKSLAAIADDDKLSGVTSNIEGLASVGESLLEYEDAHKVEVSKSGFQDGSKTYPFQAAAEAE